MSLNLKQVPNTPGIYKFFSKNKIIYIGKAKDLNKRVSSYFGKAFKDRKTQQIKILTDKIETFSTNTEAEALILEQSLIKENLPKFNILLRDDKTYPYIYFSMEKKYPSVNMIRSKHNVSKDYFGPFISAKAVKSLIKDLQKIFQIRNCSDSTFKNRSRPCIEYQMQRCSAPCVNFISQTDYYEDIIAAQEYTSSNGKKTKSLMLAQMQKLSNHQEFERANEIKKRITSLDFLHQEQSFKIALSSIDLFTCISKLDRTGVCILSVRDGKIRGTKTYCLQGNLLKDIDSLYQSIIFSYYQNRFSLPEKIFLNIKPKNSSIIKRAVNLKFKKHISIISSINSDIKKVAKLAKLNAHQVIKNRVNKSEKYLFAFKDLMNYVATSDENFSIEGFDVSHHGGKNGVASAVRFSNQGAVKSKYLLFNIPDKLAGNDVGSIKNVIERRINKASTNPLPNIILIDGGILQLKAALSAFKTFTKKHPLILSIVKGSNRVRSTETILAQNGIIEMPKDCPGFLLLQEIRNESHRFAITSNRKKKSKSVSFSSLDRIMGLGPYRKKKLLNYFGSIKAIKNASVDDLCKVSGINIKLANIINKNL
jgi:excinuclease ABC subunit C